MYYDTPIQLGALPTDKGGGNKGIAVPKKFIKDEIGPYDIESEPVPVPILQCPSYYWMGGLAAFWIFWKYFLPQVFHKNKS